MTWAGTFFIIAFLDFPFLESIHANSIEPSIGRKPNVTHATDCKLQLSPSYQYLC